MSVSPRERWQLASCSQGKENEKHVVIYYYRYDTKDNMSNRLVCVSVDTLIPHPSKANIPCRKIEFELPSSKSNYLSYGMSCICTSGKSLYFFGGKEHDRYTLDQVFSTLKKVYSYNLNHLPRKVGQITPCQDMIHGMCKPFLAQVGEDCIYVLNYGQTQSSDSFKLAFHEFNFKENKWTPLSDNDIINKSDCNRGTRNELDSIAHVVIGRKLHISIGNSSFTFDTESRVWEDCRLFENFWSDNGGHSPLDFYGSEVWHGAVSHEKAKKERRREVGKKGGPPFGFFGRGILWDEKILLGVHYAENCPLVAFLLDDEKRIVRSQPVASNLDLEDDMLCYGARLVDLGREDGYFGLLHLVSDDDESCYYSSSLDMDMELVTFQVWRPEVEMSDEDEFLKCRVVGREVVVEHCPNSCDTIYNAFCV